MALKAAQAMGLRTVYTDHSLFGFDDMSSIAINKVMKWILANADAAICVSHCNKDNLTLRAAFNPA
jgi:phosphatidylinositol glycan class A protein